MRPTNFGTGHAGPVTGSRPAELGNDELCVDAIVIGPSRCGGVGRGGTR